MAIGGAIGVGLFLGSSVTIRLAGPAVILSYLLGAGIALIMSYALAEMAVVQPVAGAFGVYAETYLNHWAGFTVRATYSAAQIIAIGAEVTAAGNLHFLLVSECSAVDMGRVGLGRSGGTQRHESQPSGRV